MKAVLQRVASASVTVDSLLISSIGKGVLVFAAIASEDTKKEVESMAAKVLKMKLWPDETGATKWKRNVQDIKGEVLCISQFTLLASTKKGNKPDFHGAASGEMAKELYDHFFAQVQELYEPEKVKNGVFQAMMEVNIQNFGPVSVDYTSRDEAVPSRILLSVAYWPVLTNSAPQVTLEIETHPPKAQEGPERTRGSTNEERKGTAESFQLPAESLV